MAIAGQYYLYTLVTWLWMVVCVCFEKIFECILPNLTFFTKGKLEDLRPLFEHLKAHDYSTGMPSARAMCDIIDTYH